MGSFAKPADATQNVYHLINAQNISIQSEGWAGTERVCSSLSGDASLRPHSDLLTSRVSIIIIHDDTLHVEEEPFKYDASEINQDWPG